jgi:LuxR family maltose regulon positive regulatory protein
MATGISDREIAQRLVLAESTIKSHAKRIYVKLDVKNRLQAVQCARELNLL